MDRDIALKVKDALEGIAESFEDIVTSLATIAENTTPAAPDDTQPEANVNDSRGQEEELEEEPEETKGGNK